jgi:hypothetical protein
MLWITDEDSDCGVERGDYTNNRVALLYDEMNDFIKQEVKKKGVSELCRNMYLEKKMSYLWIYDALIKTQIICPYCSDHAYYIGTYDLQNCFKGLILNIVTLDNPVEYIEEEWFNCAEYMFYNKKLYTVSMQSSMMEYVEIDCLLTNRIE